MTKDLTPIEKNTIKQFTSELIKRLVKIQDSKTYEDLIKASKSIDKFMDNVDDSAFDKLMIKIHNYE